MKVFISHQSKDAEIASDIYRELKHYGIKAYLDTFDNSLVYDSEALTEHLKNIVRESSDILVVMSENTASSWWVPFEIGMAANQDLPTVTFLQNSVGLPKYLDYWPRLKTLNDIEKYVRIRREHKEHMQETRKALDSSIEMFSQRSASTTDTFYKRLKSVL